MFLLGHSFGGTYAMAYITKYPQRVKKLVLSASGAADLKTMESAMQHMRTLLRPAQAKIYAKWTSRETKQSDPVKARIESLRVTAPLYVVKAEFVAEVEKKLTDLAHYNPVVNDLVWRSMKRQAFDVRSALGSLKTPALILDGDRDFLGPAVPTSLKDSIPNSRLYILKNCSHYPWLDAPEEYFKLIRDFLT